MFTLLFGIVLIICIILLARGEKSQKPHYKYLAIILLSTTVLASVSFYVYLAIVMD